MEYSAAEGVKKFLARRDIAPLSAEYAAKAEFTLQVRASESEELRAALNDFLNGRAEITLLGGCDGYFPLQ